MFNLLLRRHLAAFYGLAIAMALLVVTNSSTAAETSNGLFPLPNGYSVYNSQLDSYFKILNLNINLDVSGTDEEVFKKISPFDSPLAETPWLLTTRAELFAEYVRSKNARDQIRLLYDNLDAFYEEFAKHLSNDPEKKALADITYSLREAMIKAGNKNELGYERNLPIRFFIGTDKVFQVEGVSPDRLAINTGSEIIFNIRKLNEKPHWSFSELVQILSHEVLHIVKTVDLPLKDKWSAELANFVAENTTNLDLPNHEKVAIIDLSKNRIPERKIRVNWSETLQEYFLRELKRTILILKTTASGTSFWDSMYDGFQSFEGAIGKKLDKFQYDHQHIYYKVLFPIIKMNSAKLNSKGQVVIDYSQTGKTYMYSMESKVYMDPKTMGTVEFRWYNFPDDLKATSYRVEHNADSSVYELKRSYDTKLSEHDFEISRVVEIKNGKKFVSIRLKISEEELKTIPLSKTKSETFLVARIPGRTNPLSLPLIEFRYIGQAEALLHFEVPDVQLELSYLQFPARESKQNGFDKTIKILPTSKQELAGNIPSGRAPPLPTVKSVSVVASQDGKARLQNREAPKITIEIQETKPIKGFLIDIEHLVTAYGVDWKGPKRSLPNAYGFMEGQGPAQGDRDEIAKVSFGRNYFIQGKDAMKKGSAFVIELPTDPINEIVYGEEYTRTISWAYKVKLREQATKLADTGFRKMTDVWIYYQDGSVQKIDRAQLPDYFRNGHLLEKNKTEPSSKPTSVLSCQKVHLKRI